jgi:hypothetical protein
MLQGQYLKTVLVAVWRKLNSLLLLLESHCKEVVSVILVMTSFNWLIVSMLMAPNFFAEDIDYSLIACFKALAILEHLVDRDHRHIIDLYPPYGRNSMNCLPWSSIQHHICNPTTAGLECS